MGQAWGSPAQQTGYAQNFDPNQMAAWNQFSKGGQGGQMPSAYDVTQNPLYSQASNQVSQQLNPYNSPQFNQQFQDAFVNPAMKSYNEEVLPSIRSQYYSPTAAYGAGLNQAINKSAENLQQGLGQLRAQYGLSQQGMGAANSLGLIQQQQNSGQNYYNQLFGASPVSALVQGPQSGPLKDVLQMITSVLGGAAQGYAQRG